MSAIWFFHTEGDDIAMRARMEADDGAGGTIISDAFDYIGPEDTGLSTLGLTYAALREAGAGILEIAEDGESFTIMPSKTHPHSAGAQARGLIETE